MDRREEKEHDNPEGLHGVSGTTNPSDFFLTLQPSGQVEKVSKPGCSTILALPLDKEGEEIHWFPFLT